MRIPTVMIEGEDGNPLVINQDEFDATKHKIYGAADIVAAAVQQPPAVVPAAPVANDANGNPVNAGDGGQMVPPTQAGELRKDGPTIEQYVSAGYDPKTYPPSGYESRSTKDEIDAAIAKATPAPELMLVQKKGRKFMVVNLTGEPIQREGINSEGYASEEDANAAITAINAPATT